MEKSDLKKTKIIYWCVTALFLLPTAGSGIPEMLGALPEQTVMSFQHLGFPLYLATILGFAKVMGAAAIIVDRFKTMKEWAYAGFTFNFLGAAASHAFSGDVGPVFIPLSVLTVMVVSYFLWRKIEKAPQN